MKKSPMISLPAPALLLAGALLACAACATPGGDGAAVSTGADADQSAADETILFEDSMTGDWRENWFIDGEKALLENSGDGLEFTADTVEGIWEMRNESKKKRRLFDSLHAVLWTKEVFEGEVAISYELTRKSEGGTFLLYMLAQGIGERPYVEDIREWQDLRDIPVMSLYFDKMNLTGITFRNQLRLRRYPWSGDDGERYSDLKIGEFIDYDQFPTGKTYRVNVELRHETLSLRIEEVGNPQNVVDRTYSRIEGLDPRRPAPSTKGRIGLRHMTGCSVVYKNFQVRPL
jgi:hypothetical protein